VFFTNNYWRFTGTSASFVAYNPGDETVTGPLVRPGQPIDNGGTPVVLNALEDWKYEDGNYTLVQNKISAAKPLDLVNWSKEGTDYTTVIYLPEFAQAAGFPGVVSIDLEFAMNYIGDSGGNEDIMDSSTSSWSVVIDFASCIAVTSIQPSRLSSQGNFFAAAAWAYGKLLDLTNPSIKVTIKSKWLEKGSSKQTFYQPGSIVGNAKVEPVWPSPTPVLGAYCAHCKQRRSTPPLTSAAEDWELV
jgi:hypothetical protein